MPAKPPVPVQAYAGVRYPERPLRVLWQGRWRDVAQVLHQEQHPDRRCFTVRLAGRRDTSLRLCYDYANDAWGIEPMPAGPRETSAK